MTDYLDLTTNAEALPTIIAAKTLGALQSNMVLIHNVNRDYEDEVAEEGQIVKVNVRGALSVNDKSEGSNVTVQDPTLTAVSVTLNKHKEVTFGQEDIAAMLQKPDVIPGYCEDAAIGIVEEIEADLAALYSGFSQTIDATAGLTAANFREAARQMNSAKVPVRGRVAILHEDAFAEAEDIEKLINRDYQGDPAYQAVREAWLGKLNSFDVMLDQNIATNSSQCKNLFMHRNAIALATRPMRITKLKTVAQATMSFNGIGLRVTHWYNANALAEQLTIDVLYGVAELRDNHCVVVSTTES